jgi:hypothetical protein
MTDGALAGWREPDNDLIQTALSRIGDRQHRRVFFDRLQNPRWVAALDARGVFDSPSETSRDEAGQELWTPWPQGAYLVRMAPLVPAAVGQIFARVSDSSNPYVHELVLQAALALPAAEAQALVGPIESYLQRGTLLNGEEVVALIEAFANAGLRGPAVGIAQAAFRPRPANRTEGDRLRRQRVAVGLGRYWYDELLSRVVTALDPVLGDEVLTIVAVWLEVLQEASGDYNPGSGSDLSFMWRPAIGEHSQNSRYHEFGDSLVEAVRDRALADVRRGRPVAEVLSTLERSGQPLLSRIAMYVLAATAGHQQDARTDGYTRLLDSRLLDYEYRHEYAELARSVLPLLNHGEVQAWEALILGGPLLGQEALEERAARQLQPGEQLGQAIQRYREVWQLNILSAIGQESLAAGAGAHLAQLVNRYGELPHPDFPSYSSSWSGPDSPVAAEELVEKSVDEVLALLTSWKPEGSEAWGASKEGLAQTFQRVVASRAQEFSSEAASFAQLDPTYVRALFSGLTDAANAGSKLDWEQVLNAARVVSLNPDDGADFEGRIEEDVVWRYAQRAVASLLERGTSPGVQNGVPVELLGRALDAIAPLINHPDPTPKHEEQYGGSNMDPLTLSLNTTRPAAIRAIARVASRAKTLSDQKDGEQEAQRAIRAALQLLDERLLPRRDESLASAAAFGEALGRLIWIDREWTVGHSDHLLTQDDFGDVVLSTALATYHPSRPLMEVVAAAAHAVIERVAAGGTAVSGWRTDRSPVELIGDHLVLLRIQGVIDADDPMLASFFGRAPVRARARVLGHLGWLLMQSEEVPPASLDRAAELWETRATAVTCGESTVDELADFYWWVRADKFESTWWLPHLRQASTSAEFDPKGMLGEALEKTAPEEPGAVADILEILLAKRGEQPLGRYDLVEHAPAIIAAALDSRNRGTTETGQRIMDALGRSGHIRIDELVQQRRSRPGLTGTQRMR